MKQLLATTDFKKEAASFYNKEINFKEIFQVVNLKTVIVRQSFIDQAQKDLQEMGWEIAFIQMGKNVKFEDTDHTNYVTNKKIPVAIRENGQVVIHDLFLHLYPLLMKAKNKDFTFFNQLSEIMTKKGTHAEKMVDGAFFEVYTAQLCSQDYCDKGFLEAVETDFIKNLLTGPDSKKYNARFDQSADLMNNTICSQKQVKKAA